MSLLINKTLKHYNDLLASKEPAPGGGSTAALAGALGAALTMMVVNLSIGKKSYEALDDDIKEKFEEDFEIIADIKEELEKLVDEDTIAFNKFMAAMKMPKDNEEQLALREEKMQEASRYALEVPMTTAHKCFEILAHQKTIATYGNKNAVSDVGVGALLAFAGLEGAVLNVNINLPGIKDEALRNSAMEKCKFYIEKGTELQKEVMDIVNSRMG